METTFEVTITRTLVQRRAVLIEAENAEHAKSLVESLYYESEYDEDFTDSDLVLENVELKAEG